MFGENVLFGRKEVSFDDKGRMVVPAQTKREKGDQLVLVYDKDLDTHKLYSVKRFGEILTEIDEKLLSAKNKKEELYYKKRLYEMSKSVLKYSSVDSLGRIIIKDTFDKDVKKVLCIGCRDHLIIEPVEPVKNKK